MTVNANVLDIASLVATWISAIVTAVDLMALVAKASFINAQLDPFYWNRRSYHLERWAKAHGRGFFLIAPFAQPPTDPVVRAQLTGLCGIAKA